MGDCYRNSKSPIENGKRMTGDISPLTRSKNVVKLLLGRSIISNSKIRKTEMSIPAVSQVEHSSRFRNELRAMDLNSGKMNNFSEYGNLVILLGSKVYI